MIQKKMKTEILYKQILKNIQLKQAKGIGQQAEILALKQMGEGLIILMI